MTNVVSTNEPIVQVTPLEERVQINICESTTEIIVSTTGPQGPQGERGNQIFSGPSDPSDVIGLVDDLYINTVSGLLFGPKTESGWGSGVLLGSGLTLDEVAYTHYQTTSSQTWNILQADHGLYFNPNVTVVDLSGNVVEGDCQYSSGNITITFSEAIAGLAYLS